MNDVYQIVTDRILEDMSKGVIPWQKPWIGTGGTYNVISGRRYSLLNSMLLKHDGAYGTIRQWNKLHGKIRKHEKGERIVFFSMEEDTDRTVRNEETEKVVKRLYPVLRYYTVFHCSQVEEGVDPFPVPIHPKRIYHEPVKEAEDIFREFVQSAGIKFQQEQSDRAYYSPGEDMIHVPVLEQFWETVEYYGTLFHEAVHATGHPSRLNRPGVKHVSFGSRIYSREELIAEIGSAFLLGSIGLLTDSSRVNSAAYIQGWMQAIQADKQMFVRAASSAEKAARFFMEHSGRSPDNTNTAAAMQ